MSGQGLVRSGCAGGRKGGGGSGDSLVIAPMCLSFCLRGDKGECVCNTEEFAECLFSPQGEKMCVRVIWLAFALSFVFLIFFEILRE